jgi:hypothetical protein
MDFKYQTKSGRLTDKRKNELRAYAKFKLGFKPNAPLRKVLTELDVTEDEFYPYMEEFIAAELKLIADKMREKELKKQKQNERRKIVRKQKKVKKVITPPPPPIYFTYNITEGFDFVEWRDVMAQHKGQTITMTYVDNNNDIIETHEYDIPVETKEFKRFVSSLWYEQHHFRNGSDDSKFQSNNYEGQIVVFVATGIDRLNETINQIFRDGPTNCLLTPIKNWVISKLEEIENKRSREKYITMLNKVDDYLEQYPTGVPRESIKEIANNLRVTISVEFPFQKNPFIVEKPDTKSQTSFKFMNTRYNHVDEITDLTKFTECTQTELSDKIKDCDEKQISYYFTMNNRNINKVYVNGEIFGLSHSYYKFIGEFENKYDIGSWKIDAIKHPEITNFLVNSCHYNCCMDFPNAPTTEVIHIDQQACYKNYDKCKYYIGFLSKITDFRFTDKIQGIGIYQITNIKITNEKFKRYNDFMKLYVDFNSYPSPSLEFLNSVGTYDIIGGCWGMDSHLNMDFISEDDSTFMKKDNGVPYYSKYIGLCNSLNYEKKYYLHGTEEIAQTIRQNTECEVLRYGVNLFNRSDDNTNALTSVLTKKKHVFHLSHLTAFILDYAKLNIIEQLMEMPFENIVRVNSDGIYFNAWGVYSINLKDYEHKAWIDSERRSKFYSKSLKLKNNYVEKPSKAFNDITGKFTTYSTSEYFCSNTIDYNISYKFGQFRDFYKTQLAVGGGGSGKTHFNLVDTGSVNIMYLAPSWKLARNKSVEYGCSVGTHASLLMCDPTNKSFSYSSTLLIDEVSMLSNEAKEKIMNFYCNWKIIFCGDIKYQLPFIKNPKEVQTEFNSNGIDNIMNFNTDYRATCDTLKELKQEARELIDYKEILTPNYLLDKLQKVSNSEIEKMYKIEDMILCQFHKQKDKYTEQFTGRFNKEKYYITETSIKYSCGDIVITDEIIDKQFKPEIRHSFTVHSIQGETCHTKLFIHRDRMTLRMFYTAISRAKRYDQIYLIE